MGVVTSCCPFYIFHTPKISLERLKLETSNLVCMLIIASPSLRTTNCPWKERGHCHVTFFTWKVSDNRPISKTVQDSLIFSIKLYRKSYAVYRIGYVADDLGLPQSSNHLNFYILRCLMHLRNWFTSWMCKSQPTDNKPSLIGAWSGNVTHNNVWGSNHITGTAEAKVVKFCTQVG